MVRITADTNVFISGLNFKGKPLEFLNFARHGHVELVISGSIIDEINRVLRLKFHWSDLEIVVAETQIRSFTQRVDPEQHLAVISEDPSDNRILECAVAGECHYIVSGDNHLLNLGKFGSIRILKVAAFLDEAQTWLGLRS